jgi:hypothetical protein
MQLNFNALLLAQHRTIQATLFVDEFAWLCLNDSVVGE